MGEQRCVLGQIPNKEPGGECKKAMAVMASCEEELRVLEMSEIWTLFAALWAANMKATPPCAPYESTRIRGFGFTLV